MSALRSGCRLRQGDPATHSIQFPREIRMIRFSTLHRTVLALLTALAAPATFAADAWTEEGGNASGNAFNADQTLLGANTLDQMATLWSRFDLTDAYNVTP